MVQENMWSIEIKKINLPAHSLSVEAFQRMRMGSDTL